MLNDAHHLHSEAVRIGFVLYFPAKSKMVAGKGLLPRTGKLVSNDDPRQRVVQIPLIVRVALNGPLTTRPLPIAVHTAYGALGLGQLEYPEESRQQVGQCRFLTCHFGSCEWTRTGASQL